MGPCMVARTHDIVDAQPEIPTNANRTTSLPLQAAFSKISLANQRTPPKKRLSYFRRRSHPGGHALGTRSAGPVQG